MTDNERYRVGIDENGLGPRLGPLIVTAAMARVNPEGRRLVQDSSSGAFAERIGDSKGLVRHGDVALGEAWARAVVEHGAGAARGAESPNELVHALALDGPEWLRQPCPRHVAAQCWAHKGEGFSEKSDQMLPAIRRDLERLSSQGLELAAVRSVLTCTKRLSEAAQQGRNRFVVDLHCMERLILAMHERAGEPLLAVCGKVGGFQDYGKAFGPLGDRLHVVLEQGRALSAYRFPGLGQVQFARDCDSSDLLVGLASLVGKYLRELLMRRIVRFYRQQAPELPDASGYNDPVTKAFVTATVAQRRRRRVPQQCFERLGRSR